MSFYIDYNELRNYKYNIVSQMSAISLNLEEIDTALSDMIIFPAMSGEGAEQIYSYLYDMISNTIPIIYTIIVDYTSKLSVFEAGMYELEPEVYGVLPEEEINTVVNAYKTAYGDVCQLSEEVKGVINNVSGICEFDNPSISKYIEDMGAVITKGTNLVKGIQAFDESHYYGELAQLEQLLDSAIELIETLNNQSWDITQYEMGTFAQLPEYETVTKELCDTLRYHEYNQEELENAKELCEIRLRGVLSDERLRDGLLEIFIGADTATTGISTLALASKVALPLPAKIVAGLLACLGLLETKDGVQDIKYATMGDPYTETDNFLKNLLGEDAYYALLEGGTLAMGGYLGAKSVYELASLKLTGNSKWFSANVVDDVVPPGAVDDLLYSSADDVVYTSYGKSSTNYKNTADFLTNVEYRNGKYYAGKATIDEIGQIEARREDFSLLNKKIMSSRASTEGGTSIVYKYSDDFGTKYLIHEVTDANGYIIHRDFDAVRIYSGQLINKGH